MGINDLIYVEQHMKYLVPFKLLYFLSLIGYSQSESDITVPLEAELKNQEIAFEKIVIDLDADGDNDYLYSYQCAEPKCLEVYINRGSNLEKQISEFSFSKRLWKRDGKYILTTALGHCCGESPYTSYRQFEFSKDKALLSCNYVNYSQEYAPLSAIIIPDYLNETPYIVSILREDYNLRYSPEIAVFSDHSDDELYFMFTCKSKSNIIGKLRKGANVWVLSELIKEDRTWLYVEASSEDLNFERCESFLDFNFVDQKARGWISARYIRRQ